MGKAAMTKADRYDVFVIGDLCDYNLTFTEYLSRKGIRCLVGVRKKNASKNIFAEYEGSLSHMKDNKIIALQDEISFIRITRRCRLIVSFSGTLISALRSLWPLRSFLGLPPVVNITTGSDITELILEKSLSGTLYRQYLKFVDLNWCPLYPYALRNVIEKRVPNVVFMRYPYFYEHRYGGDDQFPEKREKLRFFHPSHLDWKVQDRGRYRNSSKGNDRFIRAFARAVRSGLEAECVILDRGPDRDIAKDLINELGVADRFIWKAPLSRQDLFAEYAQADVVIDQFDVGGYGGITIEAMSVGKPVMIYLQENCLRLLYPEPMPVLNCRSEEEIYAAIMKCRDREYLQRLGREAKAWVFKYHDWETCLDQFLFYYTLLTGHKVVDYGVS
jgi:glycosyltransferase involved in cell wall biosynthesis